MPDPSFELTQPPRQPLFSLAGFDNAIISKGIALIHFRAIRCPGGLNTISDYRRPHPDHLGCSGGFLFKPAGQLLALFTGNSVQQRPTDPGVLATSTANVTLARFYDGGTQPVRVAQFDRLFLPDDQVLVETWELLEHDPAGDRLKYPVAKVVDFVAASGGSFVPSVVGGKLTWGGAQPAPGEVCSVRYLYRPYWYVAYMNHDLRMVTQDKLAADGSASRVVAVYQACSVAREYYFRTEDRDPEAPNPASPRQADPPKEQEFGLR